ncbi:zinc ABC transporter substrate-binding protein [Aneurinibacillus aneurinilyticus]|nr:zinc ABC transporter substrate-binding protein [Aneurinibacillus aneurinilyticus]MCI1694221.1 zinc ABC transporter substrate-binding protein [Aneurinibacillus aneurinilyticus]MED0671331.1 zinc ABC transporter substrate-binding protein [Aneurinibacillus aneurinilyticus]MED0707755.1 zinc ABC transporter substrate-binding protein [Aneurinibacillus aneurinilyticus]MED0722420.1 zinc ABC transporter substrate-binding protein [Aneurinibacillus aneurinilyticus]MED0733118.1 zinc ABC transporter subs
MINRATKLIMIFFLIGWALIGCSEKSTTQGNIDEGKSKEKLTAVTTIGMIADIVANVGKEHVEVMPLMGPGVDPHLYKATQGDIGKLDKADIIFYNGLNLEGKMGDIFVRMANQKPTIAVSEKIDPGILREPPEFEGHYDPHIWFNVKLWMQATERVKEALIKEDAAHKEDYEQNAAAYLKKLEELDTYAKEQIASIPEASRVLVTAHDAFGYFGDAYGIKVMGLQGISTDAEYGLKDVQNLVNVLVNQRIKAVFIESSVSPKAIEAVVQGAKEKGHEVKIGGELFSDAMGEAGTPEGTYIGMVRHNIDSIVAALK